MTKYLTNTMVGAVIATGVTAAFANDAQANSANCNNPRPDNYIYVDPTTGEGTALDYCGEEYDPGNRPVKNFDLATQQELDEVETKVENNTTSIENNAENIETNRQNTVEAFTRIEQNYNSINQNSDAIAYNYDLINQNSNDIDTLFNGLADLEGDVADLQSGLAAVAAMSNFAFDPNYEGLQTGYGLGGYGDEAAIAAAAGGKVSDNGFLQGSIGIPSRGPIVAGVALTFKH